MISIATCIVFSYSLRYTVTCHPIPIPFIVFSPSVIPLTSFVITGREFFLNMTFVIG